jgi:hypothetical protein
MHGADMKIITFSAEMDILREGGVMLPLIYDVLAALRLFVMVYLVTISVPRLLGCM